MDCWMRGVLLAWTAIMFTFMGSTPSWGLSPLVWTSSLLGRHEPPDNPFLADSAWPMSHRHPYNQGSSPFPGPTDSDQAAPEFLEGTPVPITLAISSRYLNGDRVTWGATTKEVFKLDANGRRMQYLADAPREQCRLAAISGAYSLVDRDGYYFVPRGFAIEAYTDAVPGDPHSAIVMARRFEIPDDLRQADDDWIVGLNLTFDGRLAFVTKRGLVGCLTRDLDDFEHLRLGDAATEVSNSLAVDEEGGLFIVTERETCRVQWSPDAASSRLELSWSCPYRTTGELPAGRLGTGSGTTPSLVGYGDQDRFVAICDGQALMHMVLLWRDEIPADWQGLPGRPRRVAAEVPVTFGKPDAVATTTEQSLTVRGHEICVVSNQYGELGPLLRRLVRRRMGNDVGTVTIYRSNVPHIAPHGVEKFAWDPTSRQLKSVWSNQLSCPNGIPTMSEATGLLYLIGQRDGDWCLEAVDWQTGRSVFHRRMSGASKLNSFYAATEIIHGGQIMTGTFGGVLRFGVDRSNLALDR